MARKIETEQVYLNKFKVKKDGLMRDILMGHVDVCAENT